MAQTKYRVREYRPAEGMAGSHSFFAEAVIGNTLDNNDLAQRIAARTGIKSYEAQAVIAAIAEIVSEEVCESNRIQLADEHGNVMVGLYPQVSGSVSDKDITDKTKGQRTVAKEEDLTADMLSWTVGATVGINFSKTFAQKKKAAKVKSSGEVVSELPSDNSQTPANPTPGGNEMEG